MVTNPDVLQNRPIEMLPGNPHIVPMQQSFQQNPQMAANDQQVMHMHNSGFSEPNVGDMNPSNNSIPQSAFDMLPIQNPIAAIPINHQNVMTIPQVNQDIIHSMPVCDPQSIPVSFTQVLDPQMQSQPCMIQQLAPPQMVLVPQPQMQMMDNQQQQFPNVMPSQQPMEYQPQLVQMPQEVPQFHIQPQEPPPSISTNPEQFQPPTEQVQQLQPQFVPVQQEIPIQQQFVPLQEQQFTPPNTDYPPQFQSQMVSQEPFLQTPTPSTNPSASDVSFEPQIEQPIIQEISKQIKQITAEVYPPQVITEFVHEVQQTPPFETPFEAPIVPQQQQQHSPPPNEYDSDRHNSTDNESLHNADTLSNHSAISCKPVELPDSGLRIEIKPSFSKTHDCPTCSKSFVRKSDFTRHLKIHSGIKPFQCSICKKGFSQKSALTVHFRTHTGEKPYSCTYCGTRFADMSALRKHEQGTHEKRRYHCPVHECVKSFSRKNALNGHLKKHNTIYEQIDK